MNMCWHFQNKQTNFKFIWNWFICKCTKKMRTLVETLKRWKKPETPRPISLSYLRSQGFSLLSHSWGPYFRVRVRSEDYAGPHNGEKCCRPNPMSKLRTLANSSALFWDFGFDLWSRTSCFWTIWSCTINYLEKYSKSNMLQDCIWNAHCSRSM